MPRSPSQVPAALKALQKGATAEQIQKVTGWAVKPSTTVLRNMAKRHGLTLIIERHFTVRPRSPLSR